MLQAHAEKREVDESTPIEQATVVPINRLLKDTNLAPEESERLRQAYSYALKSLLLVDRNDPICEIVAEKIIEIDPTGVHDPVEIAKMAVQHLVAKCRVLIIEDEYFLASDLEAALKLLGAGVIALAGDLYAAIELVARGGFDIAVLDINLRGNQAFCVADQLRKKGIPFVFSTGYGAEVIPARFADVTRWEKPFDPLIVARDVVKLCHRD
jgi:CheY-like chemotaxis protein